jgi:hypothetical protein
MRRYYDTLAAFARAEDPDPDAAHARITIGRVDALQRQMKERGATITETAAGQIIVSEPQPLSEKYLRQKKSNRKYTKLSMAIDKEKAAAFAAACQTLGSTQAAVLMPVVEETIAAAAVKESLFF